MVFFTDFIEHLWWRFYAWNWQDCSQLLPLLGFALKRVRLPLRLQVPILLSTYHIGVYRATWSRNYSGSNLGGIQCFQFFRKSLQKLAWRSINPPFHGLWICGAGAQEHVAGAGPLCPKLRTSEARPSASPEKLWKAVGLSCDPGVDINWDIPNREMISKLNKEHILSTPARL